MKHIVPILLIVLCSFNVLLGQYENSDSIRTVQLDGYDIDDRDYTVFLEALGSGFFFH